MEAQLDDDAMEIASLDTVVSFNHVQFHCTDTSFALLFLQIMNIIKCTNTLSEISRPKTKAKCSLEIISLNTILNRLAITLERIL
jgi:hypothetical protein